MSKFVSFIFNEDNASQKRKALSQLLLSGKVRV